MIIDTELGRLIAQRAGRAPDGGDVLQILGIPYARAERFRPPVPVGAPGVEASGKTAGSPAAPPTGEPINTGYGTCFPQRLVPRAVNLALRHFQLRPEWQPRGDVAGEDSLRVNVWTPLDGAPRPVLVFIHGGDCGSGTLPVYNGAHRAGRGVVVVTVTYRIGAFGHLHVVDGGTASCDRALLDQQAALRWVHEHIGALGGDPGNITLMGHCGGAQYALYQALNPDNAGLFHRLILASGQRAVPVPLDLDAERRAFAAFLADNRLTREELGALPAGRLPRLRLPRARLVTVMERPFFCVDPLAVLREGRFPRVPVLVGTTADEFSMIEMPLWYGRMGLATRGRDLGRRVREVYGGHGRRIAAALRREADGLVDLQIRMMELVVFHGAALDLMKSFSRFTAVHGYRFEGVPKVYGGRPGSYHGAEIAFFFGNLDRMRIPITEEDAAVAGAVQRDWLAFIRDGAIPGRPAFDRGDPRLTRYRADGAVETVAFPHADLLGDLEGTDLAASVVDSYMRRR